MAVTVTVRVARTTPVIQCRKSTAMVYFPGAGGRSRRSNFSAAPDLMTLVSSGLFRRRAFAAAEM